MSRITIDLNDRYKRAFTYLPRLLNGSEMEQHIAQHNTLIATQNLAMSVNGRMIDQKLIKISNSRERTGHTTFSGDVEVNVYTNDFTFADLILKSAKDGEEYKFRNSILTKNGSGIFAAAPMITFNRSKNIVTTAVQGSDNVVVESFGMGQWNITIEGLLVDLDSHEYPTTKVQRLRQLFETPDTFDVLECQIMTDLGITALYFEKVENLQVVDDYPDTIKYKLTAKSIQPPEFTIDG